MTFYKKGFEKEIEADWTLEMLTPDFNKKLEDFLTAYKKFYQDMYNKAVAGT